MGKLFDSKFKVMEPLWNDGSQPPGRWPGGWPVSYGRKTPS